jgi:hypothetical protein
MTVTSSVELEVSAADEATPFMDVQSGELWSFSATGSWKDWWISSGPEGYRNFMADILQIHPRFADHRWFCLCGADGSGAPKGPRNGNYKHGRYTEEVTAMRRWLREATQSRRNFR